MRYPMLGVIQGHHFCCQLWLHSHADFATFKLQQKLLCWGIRLEVEYIKFIMHLMMLRLFEWDLKNKGEAHQMSLNQRLILLNLKKQYNWKKKMSLNKPCQYNKVPSQ